MDLLFRTLEECEQKVSQIEELKSLHELCTGEVEFRLRILEEQAEDLTLAKNPAKKPLKRL